VDVWNCGLVQYDIEQCVANITGSRSGHRSSTQHATDQVKAGRYRAEGIIVVLAGCLHKDVYPGIDLVQIRMERRVRPRVLTASVYFLFRGPVLDEVVRLLLQHERDDLQEDTAKREDISFLGFMRSRTRFGRRRLGALESEVEPREIGCRGLGELLALRTIAG
jgi:hypothetical protein